MKKTKKRLSPVVKESQRLQKEMRKASRDWKKARENLKKAEQILKENRNAMQVAVDKTHEFLSQHSAFPLKI